MNKSIVFFISIFLMISACSATPQASPENTVQAALQAKADGDRYAFNELTIEGNEWLWDKILGCDGIKIENEKFEYVVEEGNLLGQSYIAVTVYDGRRENGGFAVKKVGDKWYLEDWLGEVQCTTQNISEAPTATPKTEDLIPTCNSLPDDSFLILAIDPEPGTETETRHDLEIVFTICYNISSFEPEEVHMTTCLGITENGCSPRKFWAKPASRPQFPTKSGTTLLRLYDQDPQGDVYVISAPDVIGRDENGGIVRLTRFGIQQFNHQISPYDEDILLYSFNLPTN